MNTNEIDNIKADIEGFYTGSRLTRDYTDNQLYIIMYYYNDYLDIEVENIKTMQKDIDNLLDKVVKAL